MNPLFWLWLLPLVFCLLWVDILVGVFGGKSRVEIFWRWLEGSQKNYILKAYGKVTVSEGRLTRVNGEVISWSVPTVEIKSGLFRGRSRICGMGDRVHNWSIARSWRDKRGVDWVQLDEHRGLPASTTVEMVRRYSSLQDMLDEFDRTKSELGLVRGNNEQFRQRCAEQQKKIEQLEGDLELANYQRKQLIAAVFAMLDRLEKDRSRFRSSFSRALRVFLTEIDRDYIKAVDKTRLPDPDPLLVKKYERLLDHRLESIVS